MLKIAPRTADALREASWPAFVERVRANLAASYPHFLPCFPAPIQTRITANMLDRGRHWGLSQQASLYSFCELMIEVAANFDDHPEIGRVIDGLGEARDFHFPDMASRLPPHLNKLARDRASTLPFFVPAGLRDAPIDQRIAAAIGLALGDRPEAGRAAQAAAQSIAQAGALGLARIEDAPLVVAACRSFWGTEFVTLPWAAEMTREGWTPGEFVQLLRLRIALDFGRYI